MDNQHRKISGYRELNQADIDLMNEIKTFGPQLQALVQKVRAHALQQQTAAQKADDADEIQRLGRAEPGRWCALGTTHLQEGLMALTRAVAQPTFF